MAKIVECVPNFSEARRPEVVAQIRSAIAAIAGVMFLDQHSDADHNRTVLTFVGEPEAVERAAFDAIKTAAQLIDLDAQRLAGKVDQPVRCSRRLGIIGDVDVAGRDT